MRDLQDKFVEAMDNYLEGEMDEFENRASIYGTYPAAKECVKICLEEQIDLLNSIFQDGMGEIDENCTKDDLIEEYKHKINSLITQLEKL